MSIKIINNNYFKLFIIVILSLVIDNLFIYQIQTPPAWDQGYHLSNVFKMYNIIENENINFINKFDDLLNITNSYRGPLTYFLSAIFLNIFNNSYHFVYLSNQLLNLICIFSIFKLGKLLKDEATGIWASIIFTFSLLIVEHRSDYLIDLSLSAFSTLSLFFFTKWYLDFKRISLFSILAGLSTSLIFLIKPTGIFLFFLPLIFIIKKKYKGKKELIYQFYEILLFIGTFFIIIYPWFSRHWLTIISSIVNAWNWGIKYQDGFSKSSLENWLFYFKELPLIFSIFNSFIFLIIFSLEKFNKHYFINIGLKKIKDLNIFFFIYFLNSYLLVSFMSTKDIRFIMPIYPLLCIYISAIINSDRNKFFSKKSKKFLLVFSISLSLLLSNNGLLAKISNSRKVLYKWPHSEIINEIKNNNKNLSSTLAILPDTIEINTFNLEAEAARKGEYVFVRQIISNDKTYKDDLKYFDWFLLKTKDQGIMTNKSKNLLMQYLINNTSFTIQKEWKLKDNSKVILLKRKILNSYLSKEKCSNEIPNIEIKQIDKGLNITLRGDGKFIKSSNLLLDIISEEFKEFANISLANGFFHKSFNENNCYLLSQNIPINFPPNTKEIIILNPRIINKNGEIINLSPIKTNLNFNDKFIDNNFIQMANKISEVETLGNYLRNGEFEKLFNLVGVLNQSDPKQTYLINSEKIYTQRYKEKKDLKYLYNILISQILQRKIKEAEITNNLIIDLDSSNGNVHLAKSIINIYMLDKKDARKYVDSAKLLKKSPESDKILNTIEGLTYLLEMKFIRAYKILS